MRRLALFALVLALAGLVWFLVGSDPSIERGPSVDTPSVEAAPTVDDAALAATEADARTDVASEAAAAVPVEDAALAATTGPSFRVVDRAGAPVAGVVFALGDTESATSDANGLVNVDLQRISRMEGVRSAHLVLATGQARLPGCERGSIAIVAPARPVRVRVVDSDGALVPDAWVNARGPNALARFPVPVDVDYQVDDHSAGRDEDGATHYFAALPSDVAMRLRASESGRRGSLEIASVGDEVYEIELAVIPGDEITELVIRGVVLTSNGTPVEGAEVFLREPLVAVTSAADGRFEIAHVVRGAPTDPATLDAYSVEERLVARHPTHGLAIADDFGARVFENWPSDPPEFVLRLSGPDHALRGRLVDALGEGLSGWTVALVAPTPTSRSFSLFGFVEERTTVSGADGRFVMAAVDRSRGYELAFTEPMTRVSFRAGPFTPGPDEHVVVVDGTTFVHDVRGVLRGLSGESLADVELSLSVDVLALEAGGGFFRSSESFGATRTDSAGRFVFASVPRHGAKVDLVSNSERRFDQQGLWLDPTLVPIELVVARLVPVIIDVSGEFDPQTMLVARDGSGKHLDMLSFFSQGGSGSMSGLQLSMVDASVRWVSESTVEFALCTRDATTREEVTLARVPMPRWSGSAAEPMRVEFAR